MENCPYMYSTTRRTSGPSMVYGIVLKDWLPTNYFLCNSESQQFASKSSSTVCSCCILAPPNSTHMSLTSRVLLYCAKTPCLSSPPSQASYNYHVVVKICDLRPGGSFILGQSTTLLESCPLFDLVGFRDGVCFVPSRGPYPNNLLLFWAPGKGFWLVRHNVEFFLYVKMCLSVVWTFVIIIYVSVVTLYPRWEFFI